MSATSQLGSNHDLNRRGSFTVTKSNPATTKVRFTITDTAKLLTTTKMVKAVILDAFAQFLAAEAADLVTNGDSSKGVANLTWDFEAKYATITLTSLSNIASTGTITASAPFSDV